MPDKQTSLPVPPVELRRTVGIEGPEGFDNPTGGLVFGDDVPVELYRKVLDFGCGCGRIARQLLLQNVGVPENYLGVDLYKPSIDWCRANLQRPGFEFRHLNIWNAGFNPTGSRARVGLGPDTGFSLINAHSVFTHIIEDDIEFFFAECSRMLADDGVLRTTWFFFDKTNFPMMQTFQNSLYINTTDPTNAVIYDSTWVRELFARHNLAIERADPPTVRGHQWLLYARRGNGDHVAFKEDAAPIGIVRAPLGPAG
jgi:SAM-dependent methyltransferase